MYKNYDELQERIGENVHFRGRVSRILYPKTAVHSGDWAIFAAIGTCVEGDVPDCLISPIVTDGNEIEVIFKGTVPTITARTDEFYNIHAHLAYSPKYADQPERAFGYEIDAMNLEVDLSSIPNLEKFLLRLVAPGTVEKLIALGPELFTYLENRDVQALAQIKGIKEKTANKIFDKYEATKDMAPALIQLSAYGLSDSAIKSLIRTFHSVDIVVDKIRENPYVLIDEVKGFGWARTDALAQRAGIVGNDDRRVRAYIAYWLREQADQNGHTWVYLSALAEGVLTMFKDLPHDNLRRLLRELINEEKLYWDQEGQRLGLKSFYDDEQAIAAELKRLMTASAPPIGDIDETIQQCEISTGFEYTDEQKAAIHMTLENKVSLITAVAGSGKSSIMYPVVQAALKSGLAVAQCALSGRAASNLNEITHIEGRTIHKLLCYNPDTAYFDCDENHRLQYDVVILDELSMVGEDMFLALLKAIPTGGRLILIGDNGQLESLTIGCLIKDLAATHLIPHAHLTKIFRQAALSGIITKSIDVYHQVQIVTPSFQGEAVYGDMKDFKISSVGTPEEAASKALEYYEYFIRNGISSGEIVIATGKRAAGPTSARVLNQAVQSLIHYNNPHEYIKIGYVDEQIKYDICYHAGDRVMVTKNNYDTFDYLTGKKNPIYNGNIGTVLEIDESEQTMIVQFPQGKIWVTAQVAANLQLGYAVTVHKLQGTGIPYVIAVCDSSSYVLLSKEFLYTQLSRAKKYCVLIGQPMMIRYATSTTKVRSKQTWLTELIRREFYLDPVEQ